MAGQRAAVAAVARSKLLPSSHNRPATTGIRAQLPSVTGQPPPNCRPTAPSRLRPSHRPAAPLRVAAELPPLTAQAPPHCHSPSYSKRPPGCHQLPHSCRRTTSQFQHPATVSCFVFLPPPTLPLTLPTATSGLAHQSVPERPQTSAHVREREPLSNCPGGGRSFPPATAQLVVSSRPDCPQLSTGSQNCHQSQPSYRQLPSGCLARPPSYRAPAAQLPPPAPQFDRAAKR